MFLFEIRFCKWCFFLPKFSMNLKKLLRGRVSHHLPSLAMHHLPSLACPKKRLHTKRRKNVPTFLALCLKTGWLWSNFMGHLSHWSGGGHILLPMEWQLSPGQSRKQSVAAIRGGHSEVTSRRCSEKFQKLSKSQNLGEQLRGILPTHC